MRHTAIAIALVCLLLLLPSSTAAPTPEVPKEVEETVEPNRQAHDEATGIEPDPMPPVPQDDDISIQSHCSIDTLSGDAGIELYGTDQPLGSSGFTGTHDNNAYAIFYLCRTSNSDAQGQKYAYAVLKAKHNSGSDNHVWADNDPCFSSSSERTHRVEIEAATGETIVDNDPDNQKTINQQSASFSISYNSLGVGWTQYFEDAVIRPEFQTGDTVRWHTENALSGCGSGAGSSFTSTYGTIHQEDAGNYATIHHWQHWNFHHETCLGTCNDHRHGIHHPCVGLGCGYDVTHVWLPS